MNSNNEWSEFNRKVFVRSKTVCLPACLSVPLYVLRLCAYIIITIIMIIMIIIIINNNSN